MFTVYILKSSCADRYYIGHAKDSDKRLQQHKKGRVRSTKAYMPWHIVYKEEYETKQQAYAREMQIKSYKSGKAFRELLK